MEIMENNNLKPKSIGGISFKDETPRGNQQTYQGCQQGGGSSSGNNKDNKNGILWVVLGVIILVIIVEIVLVINKKKDSSDDKKEGVATETDATEETDATTEGSTQATTEADGGDTTETTADATTEGANGQAAAYEYVAPTQFSGDWRDFQISINGVYYQFPFPYYELGANGWVIDNAPTNVGSGETEIVFAASPKSGKDFLFYISNPSATSKTLDNCLVTGLVVESDCTEDEVKLSDNIVFLTAVKQDFLDDFGAPDWVQGYEDMEYVSYITDDYYGNLDLEMDANGLCYKISIENMAVPEGIDTGGDIPTEEPEVNASYVAPTGPSTSLTDNIVTMDGYNYKLPCPVSEFIKNGWTIDSKSDEYVNANSNILSAIEKDGEKVYCYIANVTDDTILSANGMITMLDVYDDYAGEVEILFPGGLGLASNASDFEAVYGGYENFVCDKDDEFESLCYNVSVPLSGDNESIFIWIDCDYTTGEILEYQYEYCNY